MKRTVGSRKYGDHTCCRPRQHSSSHVRNSPYHVTVCFCFCFFFPSSLQAPHGIQWGALPLLSKEQRDSTSGGHLRSVYSTTIWHVFNVPSTCHNLLLFTSPKRIDWFISVNTCSLLYSQGAYVQFITLQSDHTALWIAKPVILHMYSAQLMADWVDWGVLNSHPTHIPLSLFRPPVFCLLPFFDNLIILMTSNNLDCSQDNVQNTTTPEL